MWSTICTSQQNNAVSAREISITIYPGVAGIREHFGIEIELNIKHHRSWHGLDWTNPIKILYQGYVSVVLWAREATLNIQL